MMTERVSDSTYKWYLLFLAALTCAAVVAVPSISLSVLFEEIVTELGINLVQVGIIWGAGSLSLIFTGLLAGAAGDRFGPKRVLVISIFLMGLSGALRGFSQGFLALVLTSALLGALTPFIMANALKTCSLWFSQKQRGLANGMISIGMAFGFLVGSMLSATVVSPWLGGWRQVFWFYGVVAVLFSIPWFFTRPAPAGAHLTQAAGPSPAMLLAMAQVAKNRNAWLIGLALLGLAGSVQGLLGYLPLYLRGEGWSPVQADSALAAFHTASLILALPIALGSDRLGSRKKVLVGAALTIMTGTFLISFATGLGVWAAVILAGMTRDGAMALFMTMVVEVEGIGPAYAGTAIGFLMIFSGVGGLIAPPLGNSLAAIAPGAPFIFWSALVGLGIVSLVFAKSGARAGAAAPASGQVTSP